MQIACTCHDNIFFSTQSDPLFSAVPKVENEHHDGAGVVVKTKTIWNGREILKVHFMNPSVQYLLSGHSNTPAL